MFGALKRGRFRSLASLILLVNVVGELQQKRTLAASRGFLAAARLSCYLYRFKVGAFFETQCSGPNSVALSSIMRQELTFLSRFKRFFMFF